MLTSRGWWFLLFVITLLAMGSVLVLQAEKLPPDRLPDSGRWDVRTYGRNQLLIWVSRSSNRRCKSG